MDFDHCSIVMFTDEEGKPRAQVTFPEVAFTVDPATIAYANGVLRVQVPAWIDVPTDAVVVERWFPPTSEQVRLAIEALDAIHVERVLLRESQISPDESWGVVAKRAVALVAAGDTGAED